MTTFIRLLDTPADEKARSLLSSIVAQNRAADGRAVPQVFDCAPTAFRSIPGSPFAYWVGDDVRAVFERVPSVQSNGRDARFGASPKDRFRFVLATWEVPQRKSTNWMLLAKGGASRAFYSDIHLVVRWHDGGHEIKAHISAYRNSRGWGEQWSAALNGYEHYGRPGLTWTLRTQAGFALRAMPAGCIFADKGPGLFVPHDSSESLLDVLAMGNTRIFTSLIALQMAFGSYEVGVIQRTPMPEATAGTRALGVCACRAWSIMRSLDSWNETSHAFCLPSSLRADVNVVALRAELASLRAQIDEMSLPLYGVEAAPGAASGAFVAPEKATSSDADDMDDDDDDDDGECDESVSFQSWLVGVAFGRFDPRLATGERAIPPEPEPFDPLPSRSPGMYPEGEEPADRPDILVDDEGHSDDLAARAVTVAERVRVNAPENLRAWLAKEFFLLHIRMYSKSRRKAPIYWQLATPSAGYSVWLYIHAFSKDTLFRVQNDYVAPKLAHEERRLESLTSELRDGATAAQRKQLAAQDALVGELRAFLDEVKRVAPLWKPNLDDGVVINFAPLWRLVPQNKAWQKELKSTWDALADGKYEWAHLAMHLWPERVVPKCAKDRSLAIAHGLEDVFWVEGTEGKNAGKWTARQTPTKSVDELVKERTSPAVKAALKSLLEAPVASGAAKKTKKGKAHA